MISPIKHGNTCEAKMCTPSIGRKSQFVFTFFYPATFPYSPFHLNIFLQYRIFVTKILCDSFLKCSLPGLSNIWRQPGFTSEQSPEENFGKICTELRPSTAQWRPCPLVSKVLSPDLVLTLSTSSFVLDVTDGKNKTQCQPCKRLAGPILPFGIVTDEQTNNRPRAKARTNSKKITLVYS